MSVGKNLYLENDVHQWPECWQEVTWCLKMSTKEVSKLPLLGSPVLLTICKSDEGRGCKGTNSESIALSVAFKKHFTILHFAAIIGGEILFCWCNV